MCTNCKESACLDPIFREKVTPNGKCPECHRDTYNGQEITSCWYSTTICYKCNYRPCDYC